MSTCRLSVIVPAYRAHATLPAVLGALAPQLVDRDREVVVVDSTGGKDGAAGADATGVRFVRLDDRALPGRARNLGAQVARGDLLAFLDADTIPMPGWLDNLEGALVDGTELVTGPIHNGTPDSSWGTAGYMLEFLEWAPWRRSRLLHAAGCNLLMRRETLERAGGFPEDMFPGEDTVFTAPFAANGTLSFVPDAGVIHLNRVRPRAVLSHQRLLGSTWPEVCARTRLPGASLAVPHLVPLAVMGRLWAIVKQLSSDWTAARGLPRHGPLMLIGLLAWGVGITQYFRGRGGSRNDDSGHPK